MRKRTLNSRLQI